MADDATSGFKPPPPPRSGVKPTGVDIPSPTTTPAVADAPPSSPVAAEKKARKEAKTAQSNSFIARSILYISGFMDGTANGTLNGIAKWGRKGSWIGLASAALVLVAGAGGAVATGGLSLLVTGWVGGLGVGAVAGGAFGFATGGIKGVQREHRKIKYKDDLVVRAKGPDHRGHAHTRARAHYLAEPQEDHVKNNFFTDRIFQQDAEVRHQVREGEGHFQDMVRHSRQASPEQGY